MSEQKDPIRLQLRNAITAQVSWAFNQPKPYWIFGYIDDDCDMELEGECYQACLLGGQEPMETIYRGIVRYNLPLPDDVFERQKFGAWLAVQDITMGIKPSDVGAKSR